MLDERLPKLKEIDVEQNIDTDEIFKAVQKTKER